jgi:hypothetical protein
MLAEITRQQQDFLNVSELQQKNISRKESEVETLEAHKMAILRKCKLEEIRIPLEGGERLADVALDTLKVP